MTPEQAADGWLAGQRRVVLREFEDIHAGELLPEERGELLGPDIDGEERDDMVAADVWVVEVDEDQRSDGDMDGLRGGVPSSEMEWESADARPPSP